MAPLTQLHDLGPQLFVTQRKFRAPGEPLSRRGISRSLREFASQNETDVIGVTETHLVSGISISFVTMPNYNLFCCDTAGQVQKHGVSVYVNKDTEVDQVIMPYENIIILRHRPLYTEVYDRGL